MIDDQEFAGPLVGSSFNPSCSWIAVKIDVPPAGLGGAAPLAPGVVSSGAYPEISRCSASDNRSFYYVEIAQIAAALNLRQHSLLGSAGTVSGYFRVRRLQTSSDGQE